MELGVVMQLLSAVMPDIATKPSVEIQSPVEVAPSEIFSLPYEYIIAAMGVLIVVLIGMLLREKRSKSKKIRPSTAIRIPLLLNNLRGSNFEWAISTT